jgi:hypothetical protein
MKKKILSFMIALSLVGISCTKDENTPTSKNINTAEKVSVDRFSATAGHLMVRTSTNGLPTANEPVNFDNQPFITTGLDRTGAVIKYYNFDIQSTTPAPIYVFFKTGASSPLAGQNNIIGVLPGEVGYNDFWNVVKVNVPNNYVPNSITSEAEILASNYDITETNMIVNCPVVPFGSTASKSYVMGIESTLSLGWYQGKAVAYFNFSEDEISATVSGMVPTSPIFVMFNDNSTGPESGFKVETGTLQTHNVLSTLPEDLTYSPLWSVFVIDNANFASVSDLNSVASFMNMAAGVNVNCPIVK